MLSNHHIDLFYAPTSKYILEQNKPLHWEAHEEFLAHSSNEAALWYRICKRVDG